MKKKVKVEYGNTKVDGLVEFDANTIPVKTIIGFIYNLYNDTGFVNVYVNDNPVMFFNKNFDSNIKIDLLEELITNACNKESFDITMSDCVKEIGRLFNAETKVIKDEVSVYKAAEHGANVDCKGEVPDTKCETSIHPCAPKDDCGIKSEITNNMSMMPSPERIRTNTIDTIENKLKEVRKHDKELENNINKVKQSISIEFKGDKPDGGFPR